MNGFEVEENEKNIPINNYQPCAEMRTSFCLRSMFGSQTFQRCLIFNTFQWHNHQLLSAGLAEIVNYPHNFKNLFVITFKCESHLTKWTYGYNE